MPILTNSGHMGGWMGEWMGRWMGMQDVEVTLIRAVTSPKQKLHGWNKRRLLQWGGRFKPAY